MLKGKELIQRWHPDKAEKYIKTIGEYNLAVLGSIKDDVVEKCGLDTPAQIAELINKYSSHKIEPKKDPAKQKVKSINLLKKWNPDNHEEIISELTDEELIKLSEVDDNLISAYGLNTVMDIKTCLKMNESGKTNGIKVDIYNGNYNEFLYNTFTSHRKIRDGKIDSEINVSNFDYEFFGELVENAIKIYMKYHNK